MTYIDLYKRRLTCNGNTQREKNINTKKEINIQMYLNSPDCFEAYINNSQESTHVILLDDSYYTKDETIKRIISFEQSVYMGDIIAIENDKWLVISQADKSNVIYDSVLVRLCNLTPFKFKIDGITEEVSGYYEHFMYTNQDNSSINLPEDSVVIYLPKTEKTVLIEKNDEFFIDKDKFKINSIDRSKKDGEEHGLIVLKAKEVQASGTPEDFYDFPPSSGGGWF